MSLIERNFRRNGSSVIRAMLKRLAEDEKQLLEKKAVGTVPVETAKPLVKAALY
jgi:Arc/MetJ-type ribon-helix-helix transcriptional regulator